jgi:hypothetical protein
VDELTELDGEGELERLELGESLIDEDGDGDELIELDGDGDEDGEDDAEELIEDDGEDEMEETGPGRSAIVVAVQASAAFVVPPAVIAAGS